MTEAGAKASFSGHESFPLRYAWLKKSVDAVDADRFAFQADDAMVRLGVGKNMVSSMRHWGLTLGMIEEEALTSARGRARPVRPTELGRLLFADDGWDPYLEDPATLWLLHWRLASRPERATTWWWVFNRYPGVVFTRVALQRGLEALLAQHTSWNRTTSSSLKRDIDVFVRTYAPHRRGKAGLEDALDCPLAELGLIRHSNRSQMFQIVRGAHASLPFGIFVYALADYLLDRSSKAPTITLEELAFGEGAPGRVFCLDEPGLIRRLDQMESITAGSIVFDETAGLKQLYVDKLPDPIGLLERCYAA